MSRRLGLRKNLRLRSVAGGGAGGGGLPNPPPGAALIITTEPSGVLTYVTASAPDGSIHYIYATRSTS